MGEGKRSHLSDSGDIQKPGPELNHFLYFTEKESLNCDFEKSMCNWKFHPKPNVWYRQQSENGGK